MRKITALLTLSLVVLAAVPVSAGIVQRGGSPVVSQPPSTQPCSGSSIGLNTLPTKNTGNCTSAGSSGTGFDTRSGGGLLIGPPQQQPPIKNVICAAVGRLCLGH